MDTIPTTWHCDAGINQIIVPTQWRPNPPSHDSCRMYTDLRSVFHCPNQMRLGYNNVRKVQSPSSAAGASVDFAHGSERHRLRNSSIAYMQAGTGNFFTHKSLHHEKSWHWYLICIDASIFSAFRVAKALHQMPLCILLPSAGDSWFPVQPHGWSPHHEAAPRTVWKHGEDLPSGHDCLCGRAVASINEIPWNSPNRTDLAHACITTHFLDSLYTQIELVHTSPPQIGDPLLLGSARYPSRQHEFHHWLPTPFLLMPCHTAMDGAHPRENGLGNQKDLYNYIA